MKKIAFPLMLAPFLMAAFFGFVAMTSGPDGRMQGDCPFSATGVTLCPQNAVAIAMHHISAYQSFLNVPTGFDLVALLSALGGIGIVVVLIATSPLVPSTVPVSILYESPPPISYNRKLVRWLSLFENSPS